MAMTINVAGTISFIVLKGLVREARPQSSLTDGDTFPRLFGVDVNGNAWEPSDVPCRLVRITDDQCSYCKRDKPSYEKVLDAARQASCEIIEVAPKAGGMAYDPRPGIVQLKFVGGDIGSALYPFVTPQTIILDRDWTVKMTKRGVFDEDSLSDGLKLLSTLKQSAELR